MCLKSFCSRHAAFCIGGPKYKKQACVLYRLGYELVQKQKASCLFAFCGAVRTGFPQKQKQKLLFVFAKKTRKDRPEQVSTWNDGSTMLICGCEQPEPDDGLTKSSIVVDVSLHGGNERTTKIVYISRCDVLFRAHHYFCPLGLGRRRSTEAPLSWCQLEDWKRSF